MLSGMKDILAKAKEARDDFKANVAPELDRSRQRLTHQLKSTAKKSAESMKKYTARLPTTVTDSGRVFRKEQDLGDCDVDACSSVLAHYQHHWSEMATTTQHCATEAAAADVKIQVMLRKALAQQEALAAFQQQLEQLPDLIQTLASAQHSVATLSVNMSQTEAALGRLEGLIEQLDVKRRMDIETRIFDKHQKARRQELEQLQASIAEAERRREQQRQQAATAKLRERQQAFEDVHRQEIKLYKEKGEIEKISRPRGESSASVDDYHIEDDSGEFEDFLSTEDNAKAAADPAAAAVTAEVGSTQADDGTVAGDVTAAVVSDDGDHEAGGDGDSVGAHPGSPDEADGGAAYEVATDLDPSEDLSLLVVSSPPMSPGGDTETDADD